jgi:hypothetical protein
MRLEHMTIAEESSRFRFLFEARVQTQVPVGNIAVETHSQSGPQVITLSQPRVSPNPDRELQTRFSQVSILLRRTQRDVFNLTPQSEVASQENVPQSEGKVAGAGRQLEEEKTLLQV